MEASLLSQHHVEVGRVSALALCDDSTHTLHGKAACGPAQCCEGATAVGVCFERRRVIVTAGVRLLVILPGLHRGPAV